MACPGFVTISTSPSRRKVRHSARRSRLFGSWANRVTGLGAMPVSVVDYLRFRFWQMGAHTASRGRIAEATKVGAVSKFKSFGFSGTYNRNCIALISLSLPLVAPRHGLTQQARWAARHGTLDKPKL